VEWGFKLKEYVPCVANKVINGKQCTIIRHVDDLKILHVKKKVVEQLIADLNNVFGQESPLTTTHRRVLEYLGMMLDYMTKGKVKISMHKYIDKMLAELPSDMNGRSKTPEALHLFNTDKGAEKLSEEKGQLFYLLVAKLLYLYRRTLQDIQTAVAFLCTRVQAPDMDNY